MSFCESWNETNDLMKIKAILVIIYSECDKMSNKFDNNASQTGWLLDFTRNISYLAIWEGWLSLQSSHVFLSRAVLNQTKQLPLQSNPMDSSSTLTFLNLSHNEKKPSTALTIK